MAPSGGAAPPGLTPLSALKVPGQGPSPVATIPTPASPMNSVPGPASGGHGCVGVWGDSDIATRCFHGASVMAVRALFKPRSKGNHAHRHTNSPGDLHQAFKKKSHRFLGFCSRVCVGGIPPNRTYAEERSNGCSAHPVLVAYCT